MPTHRNTRSVDVGMLPVTNTQKGVKVAFKAIYAYPDGGGWFTFDRQGPSGHKYEIRFNDEYEAISQLTDVLAYLKQTAKERAQAKGDVPEEGRKPDGTFAPDDD